MRFRVPALLIALAMLTPALPLHAASVAGANDGAQVNRGTCATQEANRDEQVAVQRQVEDWVSENGATLALGGNIKIAWHVIYDGATGNIPQSMIDSTIAVLNAAFAGTPGGAATGYTFSLASVDRKNKASWFTMEQGTTAERQAKNGLAVDVTHRLNIYSCQPPSGANWAVFPWAFPEGDKMHGVVLHYGYLPGSYIAPLNTGDMAVHEVGHYLGLYHTFQGGCTAPGDQVSDTPDEAVPPGCCPCPEGRDTCPSAGLDPIHNYMDYTSDLCRTEFTTGQDDRIDTIVPVYRPHLLNALRPVSGPIAGLPSSARRGGSGPTAGFEFPSVTPNPFRGTIDVHFAIPASHEVELTLYDLTGRTVSVLTRASYAAGSHEVRWPGLDDAGRPLTPGVYFLRMQAGSFSETQRIVLAR